MVKKMENESFEENLKQLEEIVNNLENGDIPLDNAIEEFSKAMTLIKNCDEKLKNAEESIAKIIEENEEIKKFDVE